MKLAKNKIVFSLLVAALVFGLWPKHAASDQEVESIQAAVASDHVVDLAKTIALLETSGTLNCSLRGLSGERGCHQFLPSTWAAYSKDVFGYVAPQTEANAKKVTEEKMRDFIKDGRTDREIFLIWNSGRPDHCRRGINKYGVRFDSCAYAQKALLILQQS